ncbi:MAG: glycosyltransferase family 1 protein [Candidatus Gracilibacteria bacterium]
MKKLVLGIDASRSATSCKTGVENYSSEIILSILGNVNDFEVRLYTPREIEAFPVRLQKIMWCPRLWTLFRLSFEMILHKPDVLFVPSHVLPFFAPKRSFVTIHDVAFEKIPEKYTFFRRFYLRWSTHRALKKCEKIIVPSNAVKEDLIVAYDILPDKIEVIWHGLNGLSVVSKKVIQDLLNEYKISSDEPLFFYLGRIEKKKNISTLLDAFKKVCEAFPNAQLVMGGGTGNATNELLKKIAEYGLKENVFYLGYLNEIEIAVFFNTATAFVFPSLEEGFGLPILQAFSANCPVICSDIPVFKEIADDAVLYANPHKSDAFAEAMKNLINDKKLRADLITKGKNRLKKFSWEEAGREIVRLFSGF